MIYFIIIFGISHIFLGAEVESYKIINLSARQDHDMPGEPLSPLDFQNAEKLPHKKGYFLKIACIALSTITDPTERSGLYEGDIVMIEGENSSAKNAVKDVNVKWKNGTVPYLISSKFNEHDRSVVARAFLEFQRQTCISFTPQDKEKDYIMITKGDGCSSQVGRVGGMQRVTLGEGCIYPGIVMHELMHTVGFWHEQSRWDRDEYVPQTTVNDYYV